MSLRCLIGHDYGDLQTERDREESGEEVVVTVREFKECSRCGERRVISENKEVTSIGDDPGDADEPDSEEAENDYEEVSAEEDDGVILEDDPESTEREHGEWPAEPQRDEPDSEEAEWPEVEGEDRGYAAASAESGPAEDVEFGGGLTPESRPETPQGEEVERAVEAADEEFTRGSSITSADPGPTPVQQQRADAGDTEFICPECGHTAPSHGSSLRPGDICPECRRGYLTEREDGE